MSSKNIICNYDIILALARFAAKGDVKRSRYQIERLKKVSEESGETNFATKLEHILNPPDEPEKFEIVYNDNIPVQNIVLAKEVIRIIEQTGRNNQGGITKMYAETIGMAIDKGLISAMLVCKELNTTPEYLNIVFQSYNLPYRIEL